MNTSLPVPEAEALTTIDRFLLPQVTHEKPNPQAGDDLRAFALCGPEETGKTQLAIEYAFARREVFDVVFLVRAESAASLASSFVGILRQLGLATDDDRTDMAVSRDIVMRWLAQPLKVFRGPETPENTANWLLIFDNVDDQDLLSEYWPRFGNGSVLMTSRHSLKMLHMFVQHGMNLHPHQPPKTVEEEAQAKKTEGYQGRSWVEGNERLDEQKD